MQFINKKCLVNYDFHVMRNSMINPGIFSASNYLIQTFIYNEVKDHSNLQMDSTLNNFYTNNQNTSIGLIRAVNDSIQTGNFVHAKANNASMTPGNIIEQNQKIFNTTYLANLDSVSLYTFADSANLYSIAAQCAGEGGNAVYQSRNLLMYVENRVINFTENCYGIENRMSTDISKIKTIDANIRLYPNPNSGNMILECTLKEGDTGRMNIYNLSGKLLNTLQLSNNTSKLSVEASSLQSGVYMYEVLINNKKLKTDKLVIIK